MIKMNFNWKFRENICSPSVILGPSSILNYVEQELKRFTLRAVMNPNLSFFPLFTPSLSNHSVIAQLLFLSVWALAHKARVGKEENAAYKVSIKYVWTADGSWVTPTWLLRLYGNFPPLLGTATLSRQGLPVFRCICCLPLIAFWNTREFHFSTFILVLCFQNICLHII